MKDFWEEAYLTALPSAAAQVPLSVSAQHQAAWITERAAHVADLSVKARNERLARDYLPAPAGLIKEAIEKVARGGTWPELSAQAHDGNPWPKAYELAQTGEPYPNFESAKAAAVAHCFAHAKEWATVTHPHSGRAWRVTAAGVVTRRHPS